MNMFRSFLVLTAFALLLAGCGTEKTVTAAPETVHGVRVIAAAPETVPDWAEAAGTVRAAQTSIVSAQMMGNLREVRALEGDRVRRGQVLAVIDDAQPRAALDRASAGRTASEQQIATAEAEYQLAAATLQRYQALLEKRSVSPQEFDEVKARHDAAAARLEGMRAERSQAQAEVAQAQTGFDYARVRAPFDGVVTEKRADAGTLASPGMPLFVIEDTRRYRLEATVDESDLRFLREGDIVPVAIDALGTQLEGKVAQLVPAADAASRSFLVKVELPADARLRSGLFGRLRFSRGERQSVLLPRTAVVERGQLRGVYVLGKDDVASLHFVTLAPGDAERVEVLAGLSPGDRVVAAPGSRDLSGKKVTP